MPSLVRGSGIRPSLPSAGRSASACLAMGVPAAGSNSAEEA